MNAKRTRQRRIISEATERESIRRRQIVALKAVASAWKDKDHPELKQGSAKCVRKLRLENERRFRKVTAR
jgi:hypothetical protein